MLKELNQNPIMDAKKQKLVIHHSNLFNPIPLGITHMAQSPSGRLLAVVREHVANAKIDTPVSIIELYQVYPNNCPKPIKTIIEYEQLTGVSWIDEKTYLSVSREQTINIYRVKGEKVFACVTDYGPISCMRYLQEESLLFTGTEYGYLAVYNIDAKHTKVELVSKMVKINGKVQSVDFTCKPKDKVIVTPAESKSSTLKRKRKDSSDVEEEDDNDDDGSHEHEQKFLDTHDIVIYGASEGSVITWDYHRKTITDTVIIGAGSLQVLSVLALKNGDCAVGDSTGTISIIDCKSLTCKQTLNVLKSSVLCLATDSEQTRLFVSGEDPTIVILMKNEQGDFVLFENTLAHKCYVTSIVVCKKGFITGGMDGYLILQERSAHALSKVVVPPDFTKRIKFFQGEMMVQNEKALTIWKLPPPPATSSPKKTQSSQAQEPELASKPVKSLLLKTRAFIHASTFNDKWIAYSTKNDLYIFDRSEERLKSYRPEQKLPNCDTLELCSNKRHFLAAASNRNLHFVDLERKIDGEAIEGEDSKLIEDSNKKSRFTIVESFRLNANVNQLLYVESKNLLIVACSSLKNYIYAYSFKSDSNSGLERVAKISLGRFYMISSITYNGANKRDSCIYIYTLLDQLIKLDLKKYDSEASIQSEQHYRIEGLPEDANILGIIIVSKGQCILYDHKRIYKVDITANKVINTISNYKFIVRMDNFVFQKYDQVALAELTPDDYQSLLPQLKKSVSNKFGIK